MAQERLQVAIGLFAAAGSEDSPRHGKVDFLDVRAEPIGDLFPKGGVLVYVWDDPGAHGLIS